MGWDYIRVYEEVYPGRSAYSCFFYWVWRTRIRLVPAKEFNKKSMVSYFCPMEMTSPGGISNMSEPLQIKSFSEN